MEPLRFEGERIAFEYYQHLLSPEESDELYALLKSTCFPNGAKRRTNQTYGPPTGWWPPLGRGGVRYTVKFKNNTVTRRATNWNQLPLLLKYKLRLEQLTNSKYNYVVIQYYPDGRTGINPHRDKEMTSGTVIVGISLNAIRRLILDPPYRNKTDTVPVRVYLEHGSAYLLKPPTNDYWSHSIEVDPEVTEDRISLTYRYLEQ